MRFSCSLSPNQRVDVLTMKIGGAGLLLFHLVPVNHIFVFVIANINISTRLNCLVDISLGTTHELADLRLGNLEYFFCFRYVNFIHHPIIVNLL